MYLQRYGSLSIAAVTLMLCAGIAQSREIREMETAERIDASDVVFVGRVTAVVAPASGAPGVSRYALVDVLDALKGSVPDEVSFVTGGYSAELNPMCCEIGKIYIFFSKFGYPVFEEKNGQLSTVMRAKDRFMSGANGSFSALLILDGSVQGWRAPLACSGHSSASASNVFQCIRSKTDG